MATTYSTILEVVSWRGEHQPAGMAYLFLDDGEREGKRLTYGALCESAKTIAAELQRRDLVGQRVLLLFPPGLEFVQAFLACIYAGVVAVPAYPPRRNRPDARIDQIGRDAGAVGALTTQSVLDELQQRVAHAPTLQSLQWLAIEDLQKQTSSSLQIPRPEPDDLAYLQYTSGSTSSPKGVMITHGNLMHNLACIQDAFELTSADASVTWLPSFHDMGLVGSVLLPLYVGFRMVMMAPAAFARSPIRWLRAISNYGATFSGSPNAGYELCVHKTTPSERAGLDLRQWRLAYNGAEPVRSETLNAFADEFAPFGFRRNALHPVYGLAEATLMVTSGGVGKSVPFYEVDAQAMESHRVVAAAPGTEKTRTLVGCGRPPLDVGMAIVDPHHRRKLGESRIGEVWVAGSSVSAGYWQREEETQQTLQASLEDGSGRYLRTGDLGFVKDGHLFVTGRIKDLIIIRGGNHYPQDIELSVESCHPAIQPHGGAAFSVDADGQERLVIVQELKREYLRRMDAEELTAAVVRAVSDEHELETYAVCLLKPGGLAKTSSGKIARSAARRQFLEGTLNTVHIWRLANGQTVDPVAAASMSSSRIPTDAKSSGAIRDWIVARLSEKFLLDPAEIDRERPLTDYGLDSLSAVDITEGLQQLTGTSLPDTLLWDYPTIESLVDHLAGSRTRDATETSL